MDTPTRLFQQQYGFQRWTYYDETIRRLRCPKEEEFTQLLPTEDVICDTPIFACKFSQQKNNETLLALANEDGKLAIHDTSKRQERYGIRAHNNAIFDLAWMFGEMKIVTASGDHTAKLFDVNSDVREIKSFFGHSRSVKTIAFRRNDSSVFATGGRDGNIIVWDTRTKAGLIGKVDRTIFNSHHIKTPSKRVKKINSSPSRSSLTNTKSVTGLVFQDDDTLISCGAGDGIIKIWDLRKNYLFYKHEPVAKNKINYSGATAKNGFSSLILDKDCLKLYANCLDNVIYCYNVGTCNPEPVMKYTGHQNGTFYIKSTLSRNGNYLISGSSDENAYIWHVKKSQPIARLTGHVAEVTCVAWCDRDDVIVTCSDDMTHKIWRVGTDDPPDNWEIIGKGKAEMISQTKRPESPQTATKKLATICEKCDGPSTSNNLCQNCNKSCKRKLEDPETSESKRFQSRRLFQNLHDNKIEELMVDLPNFVIDGVAPHLNFSPQKRREQDWLTRLSIERKLKRDFNNEASASMPPKVPKLELTPKKTSTTLLKYFKVTCEGHCCSNKNSSGCVAHVASPKSSQ